MSESLWVPADRLLAVIAEHPNPTSALKGQNCERTFRYVKAGTRAFVSLRAADSILTRLGLNHHWHTPKDQGGLADIYEDGAQYGSPVSPAFTGRPATVRYESEDDRCEARRRSWREYKQRQKERFDG
jgi:hypothetical protein